MRACVRAASRALFAPPRCQLGLRSSNTIRYIVVLISLFHLLQRSAASCHSDSLGGALGPHTVHQTSAHFLGECSHEFYEASPRCQQTAEILAPFGFEEDAASRCRTCAEACALALAIYATNTYILDMHDCTKSVLLGVRAHELLRNFGGDHAAVNESVINEVVLSRKAYCANFRLRERQLRGRVEVNSTVERSERVGLLIAVTADMLDLAQPTITLWRCWCRRWAIEFVLDTDQWLLRREYRHPNWLRWIRAKAHLPDFDLLFVVDADTVLNLAFWDFDFAQYIFTTFATQHVIIRDVLPPGTLNNGVVAIRGTPSGLAFLDSLLDKMAWMQTAHHDQAAFDETILEFADDTTTGPLHTYDSSCVEYALPGANGDHSVAAYSMCWWEAAEELFGPAGFRQSAIFGFVNPVENDINYVITTQNLSEIGDAYIYHFAGPGKNWQDIRTFAELPLEIQGEACSTIHEHRKSVHDFSLRHAMGSVARHTCPPPLLVCYHQHVVFIEVDGKPNRACIL
ncbi:hypothetical protein FOZ61_005374 [Perkinsus olseni]|uniref:Uncharacterized protein n=1 Tax=Perkinsus olseni TaxID=32597 RepID=A0A7J6MZ27_PEROL|nr:hypothetical protein FOZ61_005374 [Perkinsus olseni]KAF4676597.1 hypothetical protein FOL46_000060 [Perkinsus olseni]